MQMPEDREAFLKMANYSLVKHTDMMAEVRDEAVDICINAVEKFPSNLSKCTHVSQIKSIQVLWLSSSHFSFKLF